MIKMLSAMGLFLITAILGSFASGRVNANLKTVSGLAADFARMDSILRYERGDVMKILLALASSSANAEFWTEMAGSYRKNAELLSAWKDSSSKLVLNDESIEKSLAAFFSDFGSGGADEELTRLEGIASELNGAEEKLKQDCPKRVKLIRTLSVLGGAALALLVL